MLEKLYIESSRKTPMVSLDPEGLIRIEGRSIPEDASLFYNEIVNWFEQYITLPNDLTRIEIALEYLNSGTSKYILQLLKLLKDHGVNSHKLEIYWYYETGDDDILERGEYYASILDIEINYIETE